MVPTPAASGVARRNLVSVSDDAIAREFNQLRIASIDAELHLNAGVFS
jgi:hypothetical protein